MSQCSAVDLKAYILGEATAEERRAVKVHAATCDACRDELQRLQMTQAALMCVREEELPRRIAFVSDREAAPAWWQIRRMFPQFILPAMGALALAAAVAIPSLRQAPTVTVIREPLPLAVPAPRDEQAIEKRIQAAVAKAVAESEARQQQRTTEMLAAADKKHNLELRSMQVAFEEDWRLKMKQLSTMYVAMNRMDDGSAR